MGRTSEMLSRKRTSNAIDLDTARTIARIRNLEKVYTGSAGRLKRGAGTQIAKQLGMRRDRVSRIRNGKRHKNSITAFDGLGLRYSTKLCPRCGKPCGIVCKSSRCLLCEFRELAKEGIVTIEKEEAR